MLNKKRGFCTITAIFLSGLLALGLGMFDVPSWLADAVGSSQLVESLAVSHATRAGAATNRQKGYEFDLEPDGSPNMGADREGPSDITLENSALLAWSTETVDRNGGENSLAFDGSGSPAICYVTSAEDLKYARRNGTWKKETVDRRGSVGLGCSLAFDDAGNPAISYLERTDQPSLGKLKYAHRNGKKWDIEIVDSDVYDGSTTSLVFDSTGNPAISYYSFNSYDLKYARFNGSTWNIETAYDDGLGGGWTRTNSLALDGAGNPGIAFRHPAVGLGYVRWNGTSWISEIADSGYGAGARVSLAFDALGSPSIAYHWQGVFQGPFDVRYARFTGTTWSIEILEGDGDSPSLAFDLSGNPAVSYLDRGTNELKYGRRNGTTWDIGTVDSQGIGEHSSLAFDPLGNPTISYSTTGGLKFSLGTIPPAGAITGTVTDSNTLLPIPGANVSSDTGQSAIAAADGSYALNDVPAGNRTITASAPDYFTQQKQTTLADGGTSVVDFLLDPEPMGAITGTVTDSQTGFAIQGANVSADTGQSAITAANGSYTLNDVPTGNRTVTASAIDYLTQQKSTSVTDGGTSLVDFALDPEPRGDVTGTVTDNKTGSPIQGATVSADTGQSDTADVNGDYTLNNVPTGNRTVTASATGYGTQNKETTVIDGGTNVVDYSLNAWTIRTVDSGSRPSLAFDDAGSPAVCYVTSAEDLKYARWNGATWEKETVDAQGAVGLGCSLAFIAGNPAISYLERTNQPSHGKLKYAHRNGTTWDIEIVDNDVYDGSTTSLVFDSTGNPAISYYSFNSYDLKYARFNGSTWNIETAYDDGLGGGWTRTNSLALDGAGNPGIAFRHPAVGLGYVRWNGTSWISEIADSGYGAGARVSLAFDALGSPSIAYHWQGVFQGPFDVRYARFTGTTWSIEILEGDGDSPSLAFDLSGNPAVSYLDRGTNELKYARRNGTWHIESVDSEVGEHSSLAFDPLGNPTISYSTTTGLKVSFGSNPSPNSAPTIDSTPPVTATEGVPYSYAVAVSDPDAADVLTFGLKVSPAGMTIDQSTGLIQWTPSATDAGVHPVTVKATDPAGAFDIQSYNLTVAEALSVAPEIISAPVTEGTVGELYTYDVEATDGDGDILAFSITTAPTGMTIDGTTGLIQWTPTDAQVGTNQVAVRVEDGRGGAGTQGYTVTVAIADETMHVGDLDGTSANDGGTWTAFVTVTVHDNNHGPLVNVTVLGVWSLGDSQFNSCVTNLSGQCVLLSANIPKKNSSATFAVTSLTGGLPYVPSDNHDPDGDSPDGTIITVNKS